MRVISEDETVMTSAKASHLSMRLWPVSGRSDTSSAKTTTLAPDPRKKGASEGKFIFTYVSACFRDYRLIGLDKINFISG